MNKNRFFALFAPVMLLAAGAMLVGCSSTDVVRESPRRACCPPGNGLLGDGVNTSADEFAPFIERTGNGFTLWFTSSRETPGRKRTSLPNEIFLSRRSGVFNTRDLCDGWSVAQRVSSISAYFDDWTRGAAVIHRGNMVLAAEQTTDAAGALRPSGAGYNLFLYAARRGEGDDFSDPIPLQTVNAPASWTSQPALSPSGDTLLFASDRPNPENPEDKSVNIWYSLRSGGAWSAPRLLKGISTPVDDMSPCIDESGNLYFASKWNYASASESTTGFDLYLAGPLAQALAEGGKILPVNLNNFTAQENYSINGRYDEIFPRIVLTEYGRFIFWSSNAPGGYGGYDIYACRLPAPRVWMMPVVTCYEKGNVPTADVRVEGRRMQGERLQAESDGKVSSVLSGDKIRVEVGQSVTFSRISGSDECVTVDCKPVTATARFGDTLQVVPVDCDCNPRTVESILLSDASGIPYFITGYWWPNTSRNYQEFNQRYSTGALKRAKFIDRGDYDYLCATRKIDEFFEKNVYEKIESVVRRVDKCAEKNITLMISIIGYTDACGLRPGAYTDEDVAMRNVRISSGTDMWARQLPAADGSRAVSLKESGQRGNVILSMLRSYFTMKTIDRDMSERSEDYRRFKTDNRIVFDFEGMGIYDPNAWRGPIKAESPLVENPCRKKARQASLWCNDPQGRRIEIYITPVVGDPTSVARPLETDLIRREEVPAGSSPRACDCFRAEHSFRDSAEAVFVRAILGEFADPEKYSADRITLREESDTTGSRRFVLSTDCLSTATEAEDASRALSTAARKAADMLGRYAPRGAADCRLFSISFGAFTYLKNAQTLMDTLKPLLGCPLFVREAAELETGQQVYAVRTGMFKDKAEAEAAVEKYAAELRKRKLALPMRVMQEME